MPLLATLLVAAVPFKVTPGKVVVGVRPIAFAAAPSGSKFVACLEDGSVRIIDAKTHMTIRELDKHPQAAYAAAWSADGNFIATGDETARIWIHNAITGKKVREYRTHTRGIEKLSFNLPGTLLVSTGKDDQCNVYDLRTSSGKERTVVLGKGMNFYGGTFHPKLPYTFTVGMLGGGLRMYDALTGKPVGFLTDPGGQGIWDVAFNPAGTRCFSAGRDGTVVVWDPMHQSKVSKSKAQDDWVVNAAVSPDGALVATSGNDRTVKVWDAKAMRKIADIPNEFTVGSPLAFTGDGATLLSVTDAGDLQYSTISPAASAVQPPPAKPTGLAKKPAKAVKRRRRG